MLCLMISAMEHPAFNIRQKLAKRVHEVRSLQVLTLDRVQKEHTLTFSREEKQPLRGFSHLPNEPQYVDCLMQPRQQQ